MFQATEVKALAADWAPGEPSSAPFPQADVSQLREGNGNGNGNGSQKRSYVSSNERAKEAISSAGKRNRIRGWPPSGPLSQ